MSYYPPSSGPASSWSRGPVGATAEERNWAVAAHVGVFVAWLIGLAILAPLVVFLVKGNESPFVRSHAVESLNFQITSIIVGVVGFVLSFVIVGFFLLAGWFLFYIVIVIVATVAASNGREYRYPLTLRLVS